MTNSTNTDNLNPQEIDDATLKDAILACRPFFYLNDLKRDVAAKIGYPDLMQDSRFGYRVYSLNREIQEAETKARLEAAGFFRPTNEMLNALIGTRLEMLLGLDSILGERVVEGTIKVNAQGLHVFIPKGKRTRGYMPGLIRRAGDQLRIAPPEGLFETIVVKEQGL